MKAKGILPWIFVLVSLGAVFYLYGENQKAKAELTELRGLRDEVESLRTQVEELKRFEYAEAELQRYKKDAADVYKLRNEVRQLKEENKQLADDNQKMQLRQANTDGGSLDQTLAELQRLRSENEALRLVSAQNSGPSVEQNLANYKAECINNLRMIDGATQQWAVDQQKTQGDVPEYEALMAYMSSPPVCPQGGSYTYPGVGKKPSCNMPEHVLP